MVLGTLSDGYIIGVYAPKPGFNPTISEMRAALLEIRELDRKAQA